MKLILLCLLAGSAMVARAEMPKFVAGGIQDVIFDTERLQNNPDTPKTDERNDRNIDDDEVEQLKSGVDINEPNFSKVSESTAAVEVSTVKPEGEEDFIVGGLRADRYYHSRYTVTVQVQYLGLWFHICGGALIASNKVLTAGTCLRYAGYLPYRCGLGWYNLAKDEYNSKSQTIMVKKAKLHEKFYGYPKFNNDIGMLTLEKCAKITDFVRPIAIAPRYIYLSYYYYCEFTGWGYTEKGYPNALHVRYTRVINRQTCNKIWSVNPLVRVTKKNICDLDWPDRSQPCDGDTGGPLVCRGYLVGIQSWRHALCIGCMPNVCTSVPRYNRWIRQNS